jgi:hypothetical protein
MDKEEIYKKFIEKFKDINNTNGFYNFYGYTEGIGFSIRKLLNQHDDKNVSQLSFYIPNNAEEQGDKKQIIIGATYGKEGEGGVSIRDNSQIELFSPLDLVSEGEYYYDIGSDKLLKGKKEISPIDLITEIYETHIKSTKLLQGFFIRVKIFFWRICASKTSKFLSTFSHHFLFILTGDKYDYEPVMGEEVLNDIITDHKFFKDWIGKKKSSLGVNTKTAYYNPKFEPVFEPIESKNRKFNFFGYETSYWTVRIYSIIILSAYMFFDYKNWKPLIVVKIFNSAFLILCFIILSLWLIEGIVPNILKEIIKKCSTASAYFLYNKKIKI